MATTTIMITVVLTMEIVETQIIKTQDRESSLINRGSMKVGKEN